MIPFIILDLRIKQTCQPQMKHALPTSADYIYRDQFNKGFFSDESIAFIYKWSI